MAIHHRAHPIEPVLNQPLCQFPQPANPQSYKEFTSTIKSSISKLNHGSPSSPCTHRRRRSQSRAHQSLRSLPSTSPANQTDKPNPPPSPFGFIITTAPSASVLCPAGVAPAIPQEPKLHHGLAALTLLPGRDPKSCPAPPAPS
jgi:hypothetical protein